MCDNDKSIISKVASPCSGSDEEGLWALIQLDPVCPHALEQRIDVFGEAIICATGNEVFLE